MEISRTSNLSSQTDTQEKPAHRSLLVQNRLKEKSYKALSKDSYKILSEDAMQHRECRMDAANVMEITRNYNIKK